MYDKWNLMLIPPGLPPALCQICCRYPWFHTQDIKIIKPHCLPLDTTSQQVFAEITYQSEIQQDLSDTLPWQECHQSKTQSSNHQVNNSSSEQYQHAQYRWHKALHCHYSKPVNSMKSKTIKLLTNVYLKSHLLQATERPKANFLLFCPAGSHFNINLRKYLDSFVSRTGDNVYVIWWKHTWKHLLIMAFETQQFSSTTTVPNLNKIDENRAISKHIH